MTLRQKAAEYARTGVDPEIFESLSQALKHHPGTERAARLREMQSCDKAGQKCRGRLVNSVACRLQDLCMPMCCMASSLLAGSDKKRFDSTRVEPVSFSVRFCLVQGEVPYSLLVPCHPTGPHPFTEYLFVLTFKGFGVGPQSRTHCLPCFFNGIWQDWLHVPRRFSPQEKVWPHVRSGKKVDCGLLAGCLAPFMAPFWFHAWVPVLFVVFAGVIRGCCRTAQGSPVWV